MEMEVEEMMEINQGEVMVMILLEEEKMDHRDHLEHLVQLDHRVVGMLLNLILILLQMMMIILLLIQILNHLMVHH